MNDQTNGKVKTAGDANVFLAVVSGALRILLALIAIVAGVVICGFSGVLRRAVFISLVMRWHHVMSRIFGTTRIHRGATLEQGALLVCNHVSWLDILVLGASWRLIFLGNAGILRWPILGWIIKRAGTLFITRGQGAMQATLDICQVLQQGRNVLLFPEGKTTDGLSMMRLQPRLFQAAIDARVPLQPVAIRYFNAAGARVVHHSFAGDTTLLQSVWNTVRGPRICAEITLFAPLACSDHRQELAGQAEQLIRELVESSFDTTGKSV